MNLTDFSFTELTEGTVFGDFDCDEMEINDFLREDAKNYQRQRMANTYLFLENNDGLPPIFASLTIV